MNALFITIAAILLAWITLWLARVLWRGVRHDSEIEHHAVNTAVLRDQLLELEQDHANGILTSPDLADAQQELQQRVLHESIPGQTGRLGRAPGKRSAIALSFTLPVAAVFTYLAIGNPAAMSPPPVQNVPMLTQADVQTMVDSLTARLASNPDDPAGWLMLARSHRYFNNYDDAAMAFSKADGVIETDPLALAEYAETLARLKPEGFRGEPTQLLEQALSIDPQEPFALTLAGAAALERQDHHAAIKYWQQLLSMLPPDSEAAQIVGSSIERALREQAETAISKN